MKGYEEKLKLNKYLFRCKNVNLLYYVMSEPEKSMSYYARRVDITYSYIVKIFKKLVDTGLVVIEKRGRCKAVTITKKGRQLIDFLTAWTRGDDSMESFKSKVPPIDSYGTGVKK